MSGTKNKLPVSQGKILPAHRVPQRLLLELLREADGVAAQRVREAEPPPGPFGAASFFFDVLNGELHRVGGIVSNSVNSDGPSAHAEANNLSKDYQRKLDDFLRAHHGNKNMVLLFVSTAESCPACYAKQQIVAAYLISRGLIDKGRILTVFGADFATTLKVAGFSDEVLKQELCNHPRGGGVMKFADVKIAECAPEIQKLFTGSVPVAAVHKDGEVFAAGHDERGQDDVLASAEMNAIKAAFLKRKAQGLDAPWDLSGYTLISATDVRAAPLARTGAYWASLMTVQRVLGAASEPTQEVPVLTNDNLYRSVTLPYNSPESLTYVMRVIDDGEGNAFENLTQKAWGARVTAEAAKGRDIHYDAKTD